MKINHTDVIKKCGKCKKNKKRNEFYLKKWAGGWVAEESVCKKCKNILSTKWRKENREKHNGYARKTIRNLRIIVIKKYGGKCICCNEKRNEFLQIDHIENNGSEHRKKYKLYGGSSILYWIRKNNFPKGFQILCANCNLAKGFYGYCPHKKI